MFEVAEAYERQRGRSSKILAPLFLEFACPYGEVLDVGCGTGALTFALAKNPTVSKIVDIDPSGSFLAYTRFKTDDSRISFQEGDGQNLPFADGAFNCSLALLVISFIPDAPKAAQEMRRVTRRGGIVATAMCDNSAGNELNQALWKRRCHLIPKRHNLKRGLDRMDRRKSSHPCGLTLASPT
jgi:Methylase involved in ubiquinone/menaquinone biosynthesis